MMMNLLFHHRVQADQAYHDPPERGEEDQHVKNAAVACCVLQLLDSKTLFCWVYKVNFAHVNEYVHLCALRSHWPLRSRRTLNTREIQEEN